MILNLKNVVAKKTFTSSGSIRESKSRIFRTSLFWYSIPFLKIRNENIDTKLKKSKICFIFFGQLDLRTFDKMLYKKCGNNLYKNALKTKVSDFYISIIANNSMYIIVWLAKKS